MEKATRRRFIGLTATAGLFGTAGCTQIIGGQDIQDTDGDGVIDSEDYAPRDPDVQRASQVSQSDQTQTDPDTEAAAEDETETQTPSGEREETEIPVAEGDLISWWPFDQDFRDAAGDNDASVPTGNPQIETVDGGTAVRFTGDDGMRVARGGNRPELSLLDRDDGPASITMQVYFAEQTGGAPFEGTGTPSHSILRNDTGYRIVAVDGSEDSTTNLRFSIAPYGDTPSQGYSMPDDVQIPLAVREWHHLSFVFNSTEYVRIYLDGERVFADDSMDGYNDAATDFWPDVTVGSWYGGNPEEWANLMNGAISDLRIYDTGLSPDEVSRIYANTN